MRLLVKYGKIGPMRFASHRDYARALERGLRRAEVPMAYSSGFNPHQRVSYINPAPTGALSQAEYVVLSLSQAVDPDLVRQRLGAAMPTGLPVFEVSVVTRPDPFPASLWRVHLGDTTVDEWRDCLAAFHDRLDPQLMVTRLTKNGPRSFDAAAPVKTIAVAEDNDVEMVICHTEPLVRPDDVVTALRGLRPNLSDEPPLMTRLAQGEASELVERTHGHQSDLVEDTEG
jgi:radical SAM-linked protein